MNFDNSPLFLVVFQCHKENYWENKKNDRFKVLTKINIYFKKSLIKNSYSNKKIGCLHKNNLKTINK